MDVIAKAAEVLDYKTTSRTFFEDRKLHVQLHRPLTPKKKENAGIEEKQEVIEEVEKPMSEKWETLNIQKQGSANKSEDIKSKGVSIIPKDSVKAAIKDINNVKSVPAIQKSKVGNNTNVSSGHTSAISRHKEHFK